MGEVSATFLLMQLVEEWRLPEETGRALDAMGIEVVQGLVAINATLKQLFPHNPEMAALWPTTPNKAFDGRTPIEVILAGGPEGLAEVRRFLQLTRE